MCLLVTKMSVKSFTNKRPLEYLSLKVPFLSSNISMLVNKISRYILVMLSNCNWGNQAHLVFLQCMHEEQALISSHYMPLVTSCRLLLPMALAVGTGSLPLAAMIWAKGRKHNELRNWVCWSKKVSVVHPTEVPVCSETCNLGLAQHVQGTPFYLVAEISWALAHIAPVAPMPLTSVVKIMTSPFAVLHCSYTKPITVWFCWPLHKKDGPTNPHVCNKGDGPVTMLW